MVHKSNQGSPDSAELQTSSVINISTGTVHQELHGMGHHGQTHSSTVQTGRLNHNKWSGLCRADVPFIHQYHICVLIRLILLCLSFPQSLFYRVYRQTHMCSSVTNNKHTKLLLQIGVIIMIMIRVCCDVSTGTHSGVYPPASLHTEWPASPLQRKLSDGCPAHYGTNKSMCDDVCETMTKTLI